MARIRTIKPEFWRHPVLGRLPDDFQLLALSLLTMADDEGYFRAEPALIRGDVQPFREDLGRISEGLRTLVKTGFIELSEHPEQGAIGQIQNFTKHQKVYHPSASKLKSYFSHDNFPRHSGETTQKFPQEQGTGNREQGGGFTTKIRASPETIGNVSGIPPEMHPLQYASKLLEVIGLPQTVANTRIAGEAIRAEAQYSSRSMEEVCETLAAKIRDDREDGVPIDKFYFEDAKWRRNGKQQQAGKSAERRNSNRENLVAAALRSSGGEDAGHGSKSGRVQRTHSG